MAEQPVPGLEWLEWAKLLGASLATGLSGAWAWVKGTRQDIDASISMVSKRVDRMEVTMAAQKTESAVMRTHIDNHISRLDEIRENTRDMNRKVDDLSGQLTEVLVAIKSKQ